MKSETEYVPVANAEAPTKLLDAGLLNLLRAAVAASVGVLVVGRLVGKRRKTGAGDEDSGGGRVLLGRGGKVTRKATNGDTVVVGKFNTGSGSVGSAVTGFDRTAISTWSWSQASRENHYSEFWVTIRARLRCQDERHKLLIRNGKDKSAKMKRKWERW